MRGQSFWATKVTAEKSQEKNKARRNSNGRGIPKKQKQASCFTDLSKVQPWFALAMRPLKRPTRDCNSPPGVLVSIKLKNVGVSMSPNGHSVTRGFPKSWLLCSFPPLSRVHSCWVYSNPFNPTHPSESVKRHTSSKKPRDVSPLSDCSLQLVLSIKHYYLTISLPSLNLWNADI